MLEIVASVLAGGFFGFLGGLVTVIATRPKTLAEAKSQEAEAKSHEADATQTISEVYLDLVNAVRDEMRLVKANVKEVQAENEQLHEIVRQVNETNEKLRLKMKAMDKTIDTLIAGHMENIEIMKEANLIPKFLPGELDVRGDNGSYDWELMGTVPEVKRSRAWWLTKRE